MSQENILVIKLGALGDFVYAIGPMQAIKKHHKTAKITLLTRLSFADLGYKTKIFDDILIDPEPNFWKLRIRKNLQETLKLLSSPIIIKLCRKENILYMKNCNILCYTQMNIFCLDVWCWIYLYRATLEAWGGALQSTDADR